MTRQNISTGTFANDGSGDTLRQAGQKINENFVELYNKLGGDSDALTGILSIASSGISFEGVTDDANDTVLNAADPTQNNTINLPNASGNIVLDSATQTLLNKTLTGPIVSGIKVKDNDASHTYNFIAGSLTANHNINIPTLSDSDTLTLIAASQTLTNKTLTAPTLSQPNITGHIADANGAEIFGITAAVNAVNHIDVQNAAAGSNPNLSAHGGGTDINLNLKGKGLGSVSIEKGSYASVEITSSGAADTSKGFILANSATPVAISLADGTTVGEHKIFTNKNAGAATITPANFGSGTSVALSNNQGCQMIWDGTNWQLIGNNGGTVS
tara:strand:- start:401 stop:1387 length:987 start_codon:yes stop_codon:yes gene_type:complete